MKKIFNTVNLMRFVFITFIVSIIYSLIRIYLLSDTIPTSDIVIRSKSDYVIILIQCILGIIAMIIPKLLKQKAGLNIPSVMLIIYALFLYCGIYLGEVRNYYYRVPHWDTILHAFSGIALGALGFSIISLLNKSKLDYFSLSPGFVALFAFCFAVTLGVIWEINEFAVDFLFGINTQKYALENGDLLIGQAALFDTMKDLIVDSIGALAVSIIGYISLKYKKGWLDKFKITYKK